MICAMKTVSLKVILGASSCTWPNKTGSQRQALVLGNADAFLICVSFVLIPITLFLRERSVLEEIHDITEKVAGDTAARGDPGLGGSAGIWKTYLPG